jgi:hypothetical protein
MSIEISQNDRAALLMHPGAAINRPGAALPHPMSDPNPRLTLALHNLWSQMHPFLELTKEHGDYRPPLSNPNLKLGEALATIREYLVSICIAFLVSLGTNELS